MIDEKTAPYAALVLRLTLGVAFVAHAGLKVFVFTIPGTAEYFASIGYPAYFAHLVILAEFLGGLALILGTFVRPVAIALVPVMIGATLEHAGNGWLFSAAGGGWEFPVFWIATLVAQALLGAGILAVRLPVPALVPAWAR